MPDAEGANLSCPVIGDPPPLEELTTVGRHARREVCPDGGRLVGMVAAALACATLAGCGSVGSSAGPTERFESEGFGITFEYPRTLTEKALRGSDGSPDEPDDVVRELTLTDDDFIAVRRDPMEPAELTAGVDALRPVVDQLAKVLDTNIGPGRSVTVGGMPGLE